MSKITILMATLLITACGQAGGGSSAETAASTAAPPISYESGVAVPEGLLPRQIQISNVPPKFLYLSGDAFTDEACISTGTISSNRVWVGQAGKDAQGTLQINGRSYLSGCLERSLECSYDINNQQDEKVAQAVSAASSQTGVSAAALSQSISNARGTAMQQYANYYKVTLRCDNGASMVYSYFL